MMKPSSCFGAIVTTFRVLVLIVSLVGAATAARSDAAESVCPGQTQVAHLWLQSPSCAITWTPGLSQFDVFAASTPFDAVRFSIQAPPVGTLLGANWNFPHTGDLATGVELSLNTCTETGTIHLGTVLVSDLPPSLQSCAAWRIDDGAEVDHCIGGTTQVSPWHLGLTGSADACAGCASWQWCPLLPPTDLLPEDGATDVAVDVALSCCPGCDLYLTTDPNCGSGQSFPCTEWTVQVPLQPNTTYYWNVRDDLTGDACSNLPGVLRSALHSFTTAASALAVEESNWGTIKVLFR
jgi:hypothetical protein